MKDRIAIQEAAAAGISSMERLVSQISSQSQIDCREITDFTVEKFKKVISLLDRSGHARFRRGPAVTSSSSCSLPPNLTPKVTTSPTKPVSSILDIVKPDETTKLNSRLSNSNNSFYISSAPMSSANSSFRSSLTGDGSVSNGKYGSSTLLLTSTSAAAAASLSSAGEKVAVPMKKTVRCHNHVHSSEVSGNLGRCHCSKRR